MGEPIAAPADLRRGSALQRCVAVDPQAFAEQFWGRQLLLSRAAQLPAGFDDLLDLDGADELLSARGLRTPFLRIAREGEVIDSRQFTGPGGAGAQIADQVRDDRVAELFAGGATIVLQALHRTWSPVTGFATSLTEQLGHPVQVNAYVSPPSARGFAAHYDVHDVFVLQLAGHKHWTVHAPVHPAPLRDQPWNDRAAAVAAAAEHEPPVLDTVLAPGDALYLPRGYVHAAGARDETSAHLTVGIHTVTRHALITALAALATEDTAADPDLRAALPPGLDVADPDQVAAYLPAAADALAAALRRLPADRVAARVRETVWSGTRPEPLGPVAHAQFTADLAPGDSVRRRAGLGHRWRVEPEHVVLELTDRTVTLPANTAAALEVLLAGDPITVGALPGLDEAEAVDLVRRLLSHGVLLAAASGSGPAG